MKDLILDDNGGLIKGGYGVHFYSRHTYSRCKGHQGFLVFVFQHSDPSPPKIDIFISSRFIWTLMDLYCGFDILDRWNLQQIFIVYFLLLFFRSISLLIYKKYLLVLFVGFYLITICCWLLLLFCGQHVNDFYLFYSLCRFFYISLPVCMCRCVLVYVCLCVCLFFAGNFNDFWCGFCGTFQHVCKSVQHQHRAHLQISNQKKKRAMTAVATTTAFFVSQAFNL